MKQRYWEMPADQLLEHIGNNWAEDEELDIGDALHRYFEETRPRDWLEVRDKLREIWGRMFKEEVEDDSVMESVFSAGAAAAAAGVWDTVAEAFGLESRYVELVLAGWYEYPGSKTEAPPPITWEEFMRRYEAEKAEWESD